MWWDTQGYGQRAFLLVGQAYIWRLALSSTLRCQLIKSKWNWKDAGGEEQVLPVKAPNHDSKY